MICGLFLLKRRFVIVKSKYIISFIMVFLYFFSSFNIQSFASCNEYDPKVLNSTICFNNVLPQYYEHTLFTLINGNRYTDIESSGNYSRSNAIKVEYISNESNTNKNVYFQIVEHMAFTAPEIYEFELAVGGQRIVHLTKTGNNFTVKAMLVNSGTETIKTKTTLFRDTTV